MKPSTELFDLIKSLNKSEKRFFKMHSNLQSGEKNYLKLFDAIDAQTEYNETAIKKTFAKATFIQHLPSEKNHLYKQILKALRSFHSEQDVAAVLHMELKNIQILYGKGLYKECKKIIKRTKKMAISYEKFYYLYDLIHWEKLLLEQFYQSGDFDGDIETLYKEEKKVLDQLSNLGEYVSLYSRINKVYRRGGFSRSEDERAEVIAIANEPLIKDKNTALSVRASIICYTIKGLCATVNRDFELAIENFKKALVRFENNPKITSDITERHVNILRYLTLCYFEIQNLEEAEKYIIQLESYRKVKQYISYRERKINLEYVLSLAKLKFYSKTKNIAKINESIIEAQELLLEEKDHFRKEHEITLIYFISCAYFVANDYRNALKWSNMIINDNETQLRQDIYNFARLLNLIIHFELGNKDLLEYSIKSVKRYLSKGSKNYDIDIEIIKNLKKMLLARDEEDMANKLMVFEADMEQSLNHDNNKIILDYFNIMDWIKSKQAALV